MIRLGFALGICFLLPLQATTLNTGQVFVQPNFSGGTGPFGQTTNNNGVVDITGSATGGGNSSGNGTIHVDWGVIKMTGDFTSSGNTVDRGIFRDDLTFTAPGVAAGTLGTVTFSIFIDGTMSVVNTGKSDWLLQADLGGGAFDINRSGHVATVDDGGSGGDPFGLYSATVQIQWGFAAPLDVELTGTAQTGHTFQFLNGGTASFDLGHSLYWGGISGATAGGNPIGQYIVTSASGTDYTNSLAPSAAPEPANWLTITGALMVVTTLARRRGRI